MARHVWTFPFAAALALPVAAQDAQTVTVTGRAPPTAAVSGFDDVPLSRAPFSATVVDASMLANAGIYNLADVARTTSGLSDAYNANGYWSNFTVRGFVLDPRNNVRRDGLPINAETSIPLDNKERIEILRGTSGIQAGTSAPGGLVNFVVKRPLDVPLREATISWRQPGSVLGAADLSQRFGVGGAIGARLNVAAEHLDPWLRDAHGRRTLAALALDARPAPGTLLEAEVERSHRSQPSQPAFSLLGNRLPDPVDPRINLNDQPWSLPVVFTGQTASLRWTQRLADELMLRVHAMTQRLRTDDRIAFPFGCTAENTFDRYCSDGSFDLYDFRSEGERRRNDALDVSVGGRANLLAQDHRWRAGVLLGRQRADLLDQAFNFVGTGTIDGQTVVAPDASLITGSASARRQRSTEWYARDQWALPADVSLWLGVRHTQLTTEDSSGIDASQRFTTPWLGVTWQLAASTLLYASAGQGIESTVVPNLPTYTNANQALPALKSRQLEAGVKHDERSWSASATVFDVRRPLFSDVGPAGSLTRVLDGQQHHRGIELDGSWRNGPWTVLASATALHARRERSIDPANNGLTPVNVPERTARLQLDHQLLTVPELVLSAAVDHEGERFVLLDDSARIPSWTRLDLAARLVQRLSGTTLTWRLGVDNATNRRAWRESPFQFDHVYLYPLAPRTLRASLTAAF